MLDLLASILSENTDIPALTSLRQKGKIAFSNISDLKTEAYKYTPVWQKLTKEMFEEVAPCLHENCECHHQYLPFNAYELHYCNGCIHPHFSFMEGLEISTLLTAVTEHEIQKYINKFDLDKFPFAALNTAHLEQGLFIRISKKLDKPLALIYHNTKSGAKYIRNIIVSEADSHAELIEVYEGSDQPYFINIVNEIFIARHAVLKHYKRQNEGNNTAHIAFSNVQIKSGGKYESYTYEQGAQIARNETHVCLKEENAEALVNAAYLLKDSRLTDTTTDIEHISPQTMSQQQVRGVIDDNAQGVFQGKIHIHPNAQQTQGYQLHKALLLSDNAHIDVKPELEIYADDVKCSHGSTSGDLNQDELFYLRSRGIDEHTARQILISAFLDTVFNDISNTDIKEFLTHLR